MTRPQVVVVGGGLAGLTAAIGVADTGARVELYERAPRLGGATWSFSRDGLSYDNGQHVFMRCCEQYRAFLDRIGSGHKVHLQDRMDVPVLRPGVSAQRLHRVKLPPPLHLSSTLAGYSHLAPRARLGVIRTALALKRLDLDDPSLDRQTFAEWLDANGGRDAAEALWDLVCLPTVNLRAADASLALAAKVFRTGLLDTSDGGDIGWATVPLQELHGNAAGRTLDRLGVRVALGARVTDIEPGEGSGFVVTVDGERRPADAVVVAVPHDAVGTLLPPGSFAGQAEVGRLGRSPIVNVHLLYDRPVMSEPLVAGIGSPVQFVFDRTASSGAPPGHQFLAISLSAADEYLSWSRERLVEHFARELPRLLPAASAAAVVASMVTREVSATFRGVPGTAPLRPGAHTRLPGLVLAGAWTDTGWPATMEGAVRSGNDAATAVVRHLATAPASRTGAAA